MNGMSYKDVQGPAEDRYVYVGEIVPPLSSSVFSQFNMSKCGGYCVKIPHGHLRFGLWSDHKGLFLEAVTVPRNSNFKAFQMYKTGQAALPIFKISVITESFFTL